MPSTRITRFVFAGTTACACVCAWLFTFQTARPTPARAPASAARPSSLRASAQPTVEPDATRRPNADDPCAQLLALPANERLAAVTALLIAHADDPARASELALRLCASDPDFIREHGTILLAVLVESGAPAAAVHFAAAGGPESETWLDTAFSRWAQLAPEAAACAADARADGAGFSVAVATWAQHDPAALAEFARKNLAGPRQALALEYAFATWHERDAPAASAWLARLESNHERDRATDPRFAIRDHP